MLYPVQISQPAFEVPLSVLGGLELLLLHPEQLVKPHVLLGHHHEFVLVLVQPGLVLSQLPLPHFPLVQLGPHPLALRVLVLQVLSHLSQLVLEHRTFRLVLKRYLPQFPLQHALALILQH